MLDDLIRIIKNNVLNTLGFYIRNRQTNQSDFQKGVYRTNCLDCLDRTNVTQARISLLVLQEVFQQIKSN